MSHDRDPGSATKPRAYFDPDTLFSLAVPPGWLVDTSGQQGSKVTFFCPEVEDNFRTNVTVVVQPLAPLTPEEFVTLSRLQIKQLSGNSRLAVDQEEDRPAGARTFEWTALKLFPIPLRFRQRIVVDRGMTYGVICTAPMHRFEDYRELFDATLSSFHIHDPNEP
ncbi:MAG: hypothetical protein HYS12_15220 [Planctomycetes bacterium]|nr:hypothetical protein [Planctomycetota bacterium]